VSKYGLNNRLWRGIADLFAIAWWQKRKVGEVPHVELPASNPAPRVVEREAQLSAA